MIKFFELTGKTAFITGASSGLGEQFAKTLSNAGCRVILTARRIDKLEKLAKKLKNAQAIQMDVVNQNSVKSAFEILEQTGDKLDICINNAGISKLTLIFEDDPEKDFENQMQTNVAGVWYVTKAVARHMKNHTIHGSIMNITSINGSSIPAREYSAYSISKAAVIHLTKALVGELSPYKIRVNCISPGYFKTPMNKPDIDKVIPYIPCENIANPSDLDGLILYLASNKASRYVTGSHFTIDGGMSWGGKL
jgi:NAD(P)-dependent dehydrogenase (short-subunit alcohol dehydrogenase family)